MDSARCPGCGEEIATRDVFCEACGLRQPVDGDRVECDLGAVAAGVSDRGRHHHRNEDAFVLRAGMDDVVVAVVCDGVSTSGDPDRAARLAAHTAADLLADAVRAGVDPAEATRRAVAAAGTAVIGLAAPASGDPASAEPDSADSDGADSDSADSDSAPACTYVSAVITTDRVTVGWLGDSRAYWLAEDAEPGRSDFLTTDDSWAVEMVALGRLTAAEAAADPRLHALTRWLGADAEPDRSVPRLTEFRPTGPGAVLLCSDGLWNYLPEPDALAVAAMPDAVRAPFASAKTLVQYALQRGGQDNITVVVVPRPPVTTRKAQP